MDETIIFMSHYDANDSLKEILLSYPNLLYVYGHDHGGDGAYISEAVFERDTAYETDGSIQQSDRIRAGSFTSSFMGSLSYYNNRYNSGELSGEQPKVVQARLIYVYADRIELEMKNYGEEKGDRMYPFTYSIPLLKPVTSEVYTVTEKVVTDIAHGVTVGEFISNFTASDEIVVRDLQGTVITDMSRKLRNGMSVARVSEGAVLDEKAICINQAAEESSLDGLVPEDADTEMVACVGYVDKDETKSSILVYDMNAADWNEESALLWQWRPSEENGFLGAEKYIGASDAKLRYNEFYGGYVVVTCSTKGFVGIVDYETGENLYSRPTSPENNTHAVELLPDGNMVAASTTGNTLTIYASSQGDGEGYYKQYTLKDAHGLLWDPQLEVLWALGVEYLRAYKVTGTLESPELEQVENYRLPSDGGHDLYTVYGTDNAIWITTSNEVYQFNTQTKEFTTNYAGHSDFESCVSVKGVGNQPFSGTIITMIPNGAMYSWNSDTIDLYRPDQNGSYIHEEKVHNANAFYKVRAWYPNYR